MIMGIRKESAMLIYVIVLLTLECCTMTVAKEDPAHWRKIAKDNLMKYLNIEPNTRIAKNIVLMIGDGMGMSTIVAARTLKGQLNGQTGEEAELNFEKFPYTSLAKTYSVDFQVPDSGATMTAITSGVKTNGRTLGVDSSAKYDTCHDLTNHRLSNVLQWAQDAGKSTGIVTTSRITHATPGALFAKTTNRDWESDRDMPENTKPQCMDIAKQLIYNASDIKVLLGGGARGFVPITVPDPTTGKINYRSQRHDNLNLIEEWTSDKRNRNLAFHVVHDSQQLDDVDHLNTDYLFGLFSPSHMAYDTERDTTPQGEPSLADMTRKAIQILNKNNEGFFLMIEGARIDHAHHKVTASKALTETLAFERAVQTVLDMTEETETLVIVTADHSHTMTISGYPSRGNGILDLVKDKGHNVAAVDGLPYTTLSYANGPYNAHPRPNLTNIDTSNMRQNTVVRLRSETHAGEDVPVYARGPMAHLLTGVKEQNVIAYVMAHSACIGNTGISCETGRPPVDLQTQCASKQKCGDPSNDSQSVHQTINIISCLLHIIVYFVLSSS